MQYVIYKKGKEIHLLDGLDEEMRNKNIIFDYSDGKLHRLTVCDTSNQLVILKSEYLGKIIEVSGNIEEIAFKFAGLIFSKKGKQKWKSKNK